MIIQSPLLGHLSGTTGNLIAQTYHGKTHIRTKPISYHYPATEDQQKTQARFYDIQRQWQPIYEIISPLKATDNALYNSLCDRIAAESISIRYLYCKLYSNEMSTDKYNREHTTLIQDCLKVGFTRENESTYNIINV